jgi:hypothetical protein
MTRIPLFLIAAWLGMVTAVGPAQAADSKVDALVRRMTRDETLQMANLLCMCGGVYSAFSAFVIKQQPEHGQQYRELESEALMAGAYLLYREHLIRTAQVKPLKEFAPIVKGLAEASAAQARSAVETDDLDRAQEMLTDCAKLEELQAFLVQALQAEMHPE